MASTSTRTIVVFHGTGGSPTGNWFPWLRSALTPEYIVHIPKLPTPEGQTLNSWFDTAQSQITNLHQADILIGHSCGASFLPHLILKQNLTPHTVIMVSPFSDALGYPDYDALNQTFFLPDDLLEKFQLYTKNHGIKVIVFHGDNDPYVPLSQAQSIAIKIDAPLHIVSNGGHLNAEFGFTSFPDLLGVIHG